MVRAMTVLGGSLLLASLSGCAVDLSGFAGAASQHIAEGEKSISVAHHKGAVITVDTRNGFVEVVADPTAQDVSIEATIVCAGDSNEHALTRLEQTVILTTRNDQGALQVRAVFPGEIRSRDGASIRVKIPDATGVRIDTSNGQVKCSGLSGDLHAYTSNGPIEITGHGGNAVADTSNGSVTVTSVTGSLVVDTSNGAVTVADVAGDVQVDTSNGSVSVTLASGQAGPITVDSSNGGITVRASKALVGTIDISTSNGIVEVSDPEGIATVQQISKMACTVTIGETGPPSKIETSNGNVVLKLQ